MPSHVLFEYLNPSLDGANVWALIATAVKVPEDQRNTLSDNLQKDPTLFINVGREREIFIIRKLTCKVQPRKYPNSEALQKVLNQVWKGKENTLKHPI